MSSKKKAAPAPEQPKTESKSAEKYIKSNSRSHTIRPNSMKRLRFIDEIDFVDQFTTDYITGELEEKDIKILADVKEYLAQKDGNPYNLKQKGPNAIVHEDMVHLCVNGEIVDNERIKLEAKRVSANRVAYWNPVLAQKIINDEENKDKKTHMVERMQILRNLPHRAGYGHD